MAPKRNNFIILQIFILCEYTFAGTIIIFLHASLIVCFYIWSIKILRLAIISYSDLHLVNEAQVHFFLKLLSIITTHSHSLS
jgi:hypothetical protein